MSFVLLSLLLLAPRAWAVQDCELEGKDINLDNGYQTEKITGTVHCFDRDTKQEMLTIPFRNGKQHGREVRRWSDGRAWEQEYREGKRHGEFKRFEQGRLVEVSHYVDDHEQGEALYYSPEGKVSRRVDRQPEDAKSTYADYDKEGRLTSAGCGLQSSREAGFEDCIWKGASPLVFFHPNGQKRAVIPLKNGLREGMTESFDKQGQRTDSTSFAAGRPDGVRTEYRGGTPRRSTTYARGQKEGDETEFFDDGTKKKVTTWKEREEVKRVEYFQNGERKQEFLVEGTHAVETRFHDDGTPWTRTALGRGEGARWIPEGVSESFLPDGGLESRQHFVQGEEEGRRQEWSGAGVLLEDSQWTKGRVTARKRWDGDGGLVEDEAFHEDGSRKKKP
jgi:antitoxin component YwqK of YwqJK toxin-antitoxin module